MLQRIPQPYRLYVQIVVGIVLIVIAYYIYKSITKYLEAKKIVPTPTGGVEWGVISTFDPKPLNDELDDVLGGIADSIEDKNTVLGKVAALNRNQTILLHNDWNARKSIKTTWYGSKWGSLYQMIKDEDQPVLVWGNETTNWFPVVLQRLEDWDLTTVN